MGFFRWLTGRGPRRATAQALVFRVRCSRCGETVPVRADPRWDFNPDLDTGGYVLRKEVLGSRCNRLMVLHARLDLRRQLTHAEVEGGTLVPEGGGAPGPEPGG